jgi:membrane protease YdiL (CAAX protease family)
MDDPSDRDPMRRNSSRFEDAERAVRSVDESPSGSPGPGTPAANTDESPLRTVGAAVALGVGGILVLGLVTGVVGLVGGAAGLSFGVLSLVSLAVGQYVGFIGLGAAYLRARGFGWRRLRSYLGVRLPTLREVGIVAAGYATIIGTLLVVVSVALRFLPEPAENGGAETFASNPELIPAGIVVMFLVVGPAEEFLFRGVVQNRLRERLSAVPAIAAAAVIFASLHVIALAGSPDAVAVTVGLLLVPGVVLGAVYEYTGNLVVPWLLHSTHNSVLLTILLFGSMAGENVGFLSALV